MSNATIRHVNALPMKYEILREIKHWKQSCSACINDIACNIVSLRESRADVKREIHEARARLEEKLRELEENSERQLVAVVTAEEEKLKKFVKKLSERQKRLEVTEAVLKENVVGFKLKRALEEGKQQAIAARETILEIRKCHMASAVDFTLKEQLCAIAEQLDSLGNLTLHTPVGNQVHKLKVQQINGTGSNISSNETTIAKDTFLTSVEENRSSSIETTMLNDLDFVLKMDTKYGHALKPFLDSIKDMSIKFNSNYKTKNGITKNGIKRLTAKETRPQLLNCEQKPKSSLRTQSAANGEERSQKIHTRLSKSAREDGRTVGENACLNDVEMPYVPFEEQGPDSKLMKKKQTSVRYHEFDFIREITAVQDDAKVETENGSKTSQPVFLTDEVIKDFIRTTSPGSQSTSSTTLSTVSYKPSNSLASGPVFIPSSEQRKSNSFFKYIARFHTKKHPYETDLCRLAGIVALDNGQVVVSDINHLKIMLFGPDFTYLDSLECPSPCGLTQVSEDIVAVTLFHNRKVMQVKVHTIHLSRQREFNIPCKESLFAVSYQDGRYFVLCFAGDIHILDDDGRQTAILETGINAGEARHLDVDRESKFIFVSGHDRISCFTESGEKLWQFSNSTYHKRFTPGALILHNNRLFVADWSSHKVIELTLDGSHVRDVVTDNIEYPHALAVQRSQGRLYITQSNFFKQEARSRSIKVFEIK
ncbi:uncharacterized protein LOC132736901 [Ruditapes philippinarum]|uniref:uncharacterized protein LOC132736901 n=1 Tax=Ruditapes philippinarum TaxID=129788 RepID=UPI00295ADF08|nr:uncharacterized protein LOC132736901 [Ruditapes philippinarum]